MRDHRRVLNQSCGHHRSKRYHITFIILYIELIQVTGIGSGTAIRHHYHAEVTSVDIKVIDILATQ
ncbi:hypothetical protein D9M68_921870 [compost metagenome]